LSYASRQWTSAQSRGDANEGRRTDTHQLMEQPATSQPDQQWRPLHRKRYAGVGQDHPSDQIAMPLGPAKRDGSSPVVSRDDDSPGDVQGLGDRVQVVDPLGQR